MSFLIALAIALVTGVVDSAVGAHGALLVVMVLGTSLWAAIDAHRAGDEAMGTFFGCCLLWIVFFPLHLSQRRQAHARASAELSLASTTEASSHATTFSQTLRTASPSPHRLQNEPAALPPAERPCPECGESILPVARKCKHCGSAVVPVSSSSTTGALPSASAPVAPRPTVFCGACGTPGEPSATFCATCGRTLQA